MANKKILFVDDDEFIQKIYTDRLKSAGFDLDITNKGKEAETLLSKNTFDLISLDYMLVDESGLDLLKWIRDTKRITTPVIIFSASGQDQAIKDFMAAGATEYIQKDHIMPSEFVDKIKKMLS